MQITKLPSDLTRDQDGIVKADIASTGGQTIARSDGGEIEGLGDANGILAAQNLIAGRPQENRNNDKAVEAAIRSPLI